MADEDASLGSADMEIEHDAGSELAEEHAPEATEEPVPVRRSSRQRRPPDRYQDYDMGDDSLIN